MRLRFTSISEYQLLVCLKNSLWGSKSSRFDNWLIGDILVMFVNKQVAAIVKISDKPFRSEEIVWDNGLYPYRIRIELISFFNKESREEMSKSIIEIVRKEWGKMYGWAILNQQVMETANADSIYREIIKRTNHNYLIKNEIDKLIKDDIINRPLPKPKRKKVENKETKFVKKLKEKPVEKVKEKQIEKDVEKIERLHTKIQYMLANLGTIVSCDSYVARNDKNAQYGGKKMKDVSIPELPYMGISDEASRIISLIDVLWLDQSAPLCAFEIEISTSVHSGLLRMADLLSACPLIKIDLYIVAEAKRKDMVLREISRKAFNHKAFSMIKQCKLLLIEDLEKMYDEITKYKGGLKYNIIDGIALQVNHN